MPKQPRDKALRDPAKPGDTYNDHFQVISNPSNGMLYAFWTQASREADIDQHIAFSRSADKGRTWADPVILAGSPSKRNPALLASWQQPMLSKSGRLYCLWNQQTTSRGPHCGLMFGAYSDDDGLTWSAPKLVPFTERMDAERHGCKIEFWEFLNIDANPQVQDIRLRYLSTNRAAQGRELVLHELLRGGREGRALVQRHEVLPLRTRRRPGMVRISPPAPHFPLVPRGITRYHIGFIEGEEF